jgi:hypothetical protein
MYGACPTLPRSSIGVQTLLTCYQQPDAETLKAVIEGPKLAHQLTQVI